MKPYKAMSLYAATVWLRRVLDHPELSKHARSVAMVLFDAHHRKTGACKPSYEKIGRRAAISRRSAINGMHELVKAGFVMRSHRHHGDDPDRAHRSNGYALTGVDDEAIETPPSAEDASQRDKPSEQKPRNKHAADDAPKRIVSSSLKVVEAQCAKLRATATALFALNKASAFQTEAYQAEFELKTGSGADLVAAYGAIRRYCGQDWSQTLRPAQKDPETRRALAIILAATRLKIPIQPNLEPMPHHARPSSLQSCGIP